MKKIIMLIILIASDLLASSPDTLWTKTYGGTGEDYGFSVQQTLDDGYVLAGRTTSSGAGDADMWLIKTNKNGSVQWTKTFGGTDYEVAWSVEQTKDTGYIIVGSTYSYGNGQSDIWLVKTDTSGNLKWSKTFGDTSFDFGYAVQQTNDDGYVIAGITYASAVSMPDIWIIKTDQSGNVSWDTVWGDFNYDEQVSSIRQTSDNGYIISGVVYLGGFAEALMLKLSAGGSQEWFKLFGGYDDEFGYSAEQTYDGGYILSGTTASIGAGATDGWLVKTDANGNMQWNKTFGGTSWDGFDGVAQTYDSGYVMAGRTYSYGAGNADAWLVKTDVNGNMQWNKTFGGANFDYGWSVVQTSDSLYAMLGGTSSSGAGGMDFKLVKMGKYKWTILAYLNGDNDLEKFVIKDINEMEEGIDSGADYNIIVQADRRPGYDSSNGDWRSTRRYLVTPDTSSDDTIRSTLLADMGEINMGNPYSLISFVKWGILNYPADKYMLVVWDHGNGWYKNAENRDILKGISYDDTDTSNIGVANGEYAEVMDSVSSFLGRKLDVLANDACLMAMHEVIYDVKDYADYFVGSEYPIPGDGFPYNTICDSMNLKKDMSPAELSRTIVNKYTNYYNGVVDDATISAIAVNDGVIHLAYYMDEFAKKLMSIGGRWLASIDSIRKNTLEFKENPPDAGKSDSCHIDLYDFASRVKNNLNIPIDVRNWADSVMLAVNSIVIAEGHSSDVVNFDSAHGIAAYYPVIQSSVDTNYTKLDFVKQYNNWFAFINGDLIGVEDTAKTPVFNLLPPQPNPCLGSMTIRYSIPTACRSELIICDVSGRRVKTLVNKNQKPGNYTVNFGAKNLPAGIYFVVLQANNCKLTRKLVSYK